MTRGSRPVKLTGVVQLLRQAGFQPPRYRQLYTGAIDGRIKAHQINGIWHANEDDIPAIAIALDLDRSEKAVA